MEKILDIILEELELRGKKQKDLCDYLGINSNVFTSWKNGRNKSYTKHLPKIAEFLGVTVEFLLGNEKSPAGAELSEKDRKLVDAYHKSEPVIQATVDRILGIEEKVYTVKVAARNGGGITEKTLTEEEYKRLMDLPDVEDI